ncbi:tyrosine-type recombinase/integrase [Sedimentimonas flavescens]|uniref:tyrosine-type recombinase/integrase n=1 Tax=Sedimentimonas flavescens TaxID=2851012 RepID=UPI001C49D15D|nr:tyrosine-type recombinase/integrase [Sedimentimonas flavescens]MBW0158424.1 hypothetical protein [Sedimentimonas flavescens]
MTCQPSENPFVSPESLMMSQVLTKLDELQIPAMRCRDLKSAVRSVCRLIDRAPEEVPANINWVQIRLRRIHPVQAGISEKRLKNIRSDVLKALELCGASRARADWLREPSTEWAHLLESVPTKPDAWKLTQLAQFCTALGVQPDAVEDAHIAGLLAALTRETFTDKPEAKVGAIVSVWNRLHKTLPDWPSPPLTYPRQREPWTFPLERFPESFQTDVERWIDRLANPDPLSGDGPARPLRPASIERWRFMIREMASAIVRGASISMEEMHDLGCLVDLDRIKAGLRFLLDRFGGKPTEAIHGLAIGMKSLAKYHVKVDTEHLEALAGLCKRLNLDVDGLRAKNQARLEQLEDEENLALLLDLPRQLRKRVEGRDLREHRHALMIQAALCIEILLHAPMRMGNLSRLSLERHIRRARVKGEACLLITIPGAEVKNNRDLSFELTGDALELFDLYMSQHRPVLLQEPSEFLFPARDGSPKRVHALSALIKKTIHEQTGLDIHPHLFRSIAGKIHCMIHPGDFATLGHAIGDTLQTAMKAYAQFEQKNAVKHYQASVTAARQQLTKKRIARG